MNSARKSAPTDDQQPERPDPSSNAIGRQEQVALMIVWGLIVAGCGWWFFSSRGTGKLVDMDRMPKHPTSWRVDLNTASSAHLNAIPGFGKKTTDAIIRDREKNGPFQTVEDLSRVQGIGLPMVEKVRPFLVVGKSEKAVKAIKPRAKHDE